jgi:DNA (cytosine-5)-methyltransferase 1
MKLKTLDLFSGIGGFSLGLESTGFFETIGFVEKDKFCQKVLKKHWSNINIEEDIRNVKGEKYAAEVITGGFPCQPFSVAGKRKSTADDRYLWDEMLRVIRETKPRWVIGENVEGIVNINEGMVLRQVLTDLENEGFKSQCIIIPASGIGAWHQRKRIWIIACNVSNSNSNRNSSEEQRSNGKENSFSQEHRQKFSTSWEFIGTNTNDVSNSECILPHGCSSTTRNSNTKQSGLECNESGNRNKVWCETERCSEQIGSRKTWWQTQSELCGVPNGVSYELDKDRSNRIKSLGNSIVPQIARQIGLAIMEAENGTR